MKQIIKLTESELKHLIRGSVKSMLNEYGGWTQDPMEWAVVNTSQDGRDIYKVGLWWGGGYALDIYMVWADDGETALERVVAYLTNHHPEAIEKVDNYAEETIQDIMKEKGCDREEAEEFPEFYENFMYVDATMEGATHACYIWGANLTIMKAPEEWKQKFLAREQNSNVSDNEMNESRGLGYGLSDKEKRKVRDEHSDTRKHSHYTGRGVKGKPGEKSKKTYDILKREGDKGNPWAKTLKKGGTADWVANMQDDDTNESVERKTIRLTESDIRRMVMEALEEVAGYKNTMQNAENYFNPKTVKGNMRRIFNPKKYKQYQRIQNNANKMGAEATDTLNTAYDNMGDRYVSNRMYDFTIPNYGEYYKQQNPETTQTNVNGDIDKAGEEQFNTNFATELGWQKKYGTGDSIPKPFGIDYKVDRARPAYNQQRQMIQNGGQLEEAVTRAIRKYLK